MCGFELSDVEMLAILMAYLGATVFFLTRDVPVWLDDDRPSRFRRFWRFWLG